MRTEQAQFEWVGRVVADGGGPLLICNYENASQWRGEEGNSGPPENLTDFKRAGSALTMNNQAVDVALVPIGNNEGLVWSIRGAGVIEIAIHKTAREIILLKPWYSSGPLDEVSMKKFVETGLGEKTLNAKFNASPKQQLLAIWSPTDCAAIPHCQSDDGTGAISWQGGGLRLRVVPGKYSLSIGNHKTDSWRCHWLHLYLS
jgi:hypothetical protein